MKHARLQAAIAAAGLISAGLVSASVAPSSATAPRSERAAAVQVSISGKRVISMTTTLQPGIQKFVVNSVKRSGFQLAQAAPGYTKVKAAADIKAGLDGGDLKALKRFERNVTLLGGVSSAPGHPGSLWANVPAGEVWAIDTDASGTSASKFFSITVSGTPTGASWPSAPKLKAVRSESWANKPSSIPVKGKLTFKNTATQPHFLEMDKLAKGKTLKDFANWVKATMSGQHVPPPLSFTAPSLSTGVISPGQAQTVKYHLAKGTYVAMCFWPDKKTGLPHVFMGMYRAIKVK